MSLSSQEDSCDMPLLHTKS